MNHRFLILVVEDERAMRESLAAWLQKEGYTVRCAADGPEALRTLEGFDADLLVADVKMPKMDGLELLTRVHEMYPQLMVLMMTAYGSIENAVSAMKQGAHDYILKPFDPEQMMMVVQKLERHRRLLDENSTLRQRLKEHECKGWGDLIANSGAMRRVLKLVKEVGEVVSPVLVTGETGTGKEMVARALHASGPRASSHFVPINCGALTESLLESELFGHERGAFTGAIKARRGRLELADGGTLFLDEVGEIPPKMQVDLLRVLEEKKFTRVGGNQDVSSNFRLVCATHRDLSQMVRAGSFREDFFYRINVIAIHIPPLRERPDDIIPLAEYFVMRCGLEIGKSLNGLTSRAKEILSTYPWPGNVRELKNVIERAVVISRGEQIGAGELTFLEQVPGCENGGADSLTLEQVERRHIQRTLDAHGGNVTRAADTLGIDRRTLSRKLKRFDFKTPP